MSRSGLLSDLQANKLTCYCFMHANRRHEIPRSETKDIILLRAQQAREFHVSCQFPLSPFLQGQLEASQVDLHAVQVYATHMMALYHT